MLQTRVSYRRGCIREEPWLGRGCTLAKVKVGFLPCIPIITAGGGSRLPFHTFYLWPLVVFCVFTFCFTMIAWRFLGTGQSEASAHTVNWLLGLPEAFLMTVFHGGFLVLGISAWYLLLFNTLICFFLLSLWASDAAFARSVRHTLSSSSSWPSYVRKIPFQPIS